MTRYSYAYEINRTVEDYQADLHNKCRKCGEKLTNKEDHYCPECKENKPNINN